jgi:signal transduction histidine kinase
MVANARIVLEEEGPRLTKEGSGNLSRLAAAALRMSNLIDDLLQYARLGDREVRRERTNLSDLAKQVAGDVLRDYPEVELELTVTPGLEAECDPRLIGLAIHNLLDNACKYRKPGPRVEVEFGRVGEAFYVEDHGIGFDMAYVGKLFQPFERLHREEYAGTGIGLANVRRAVERHGGRAWAEGVPGQGATFFFTLS